MLKIRGSSEEPTMQLNCYGRKETHQYMKGAVCSPCWASRFVGLLFWQDPALTGSQARETTSTAGSRWLRLARQPSEVALALYNFAWGSCSVYRELQHGGEWAADKNESSLTRGSQLAFWRETKITERRVVARTVGAHLQDEQTGADG